MSPDQVWEMCRVPASSRRTRGPLSGPSGAPSFSQTYLTSTLGSWVTPQLMTALVPLMTLWSCGGSVIRVLAQTTRSAEASSTPRELVARQV